MTITTITKTTTSSNPPQLSSAAKCIKIHLIAANPSRSPSGYFHPVFTHQLYGISEVIRGYEPFAEDDGGGFNRDSDNGSGSDLSRSSPLSDSTVDDGKSSHHKAKGFGVKFDENCRVIKRVKFTEQLEDKEKEFVTKDASSFLDIHVYLSPCCTKCEVIYECVERTSKTSESFLNNGVSNDANDGPRNDAVFNINEESSSSCIVGAESNPKLPIEDVLGRLRKALPPDTMIHRRDNKHRRCSGSLRNTFLKKIIGDCKILKTYSRKGSTFVLALGDGTDKAIVEYHTKVQNLSMWFIETADSVDISTEDDGRWKVLYLFCKHGERQYSLAAYMTLFYFNAPLKRPKGGTIKRVCQALVFPPYQRAGHGREMLNAVYLNAYRDREVVEVNVEDPAPSFTALRDRVDYERLLSSIVKPNGADLNNVCLPKKYTETNPEKDEFYHVLPTAEAILVGVHAKVLPCQIQIAHELFKLNYVLDWLRNESIEPIKENIREAMPKRFRLMVKQRLVKVYVEDLGAFTDKKAKQAKLEQIYQDVNRHYCAVLKKSWPMRKENLSTQNIKNVCAN